jgi:hypothetical protein
MWPCVTSYSQQETNTEYLISGYGLKLDQFDLALDCTPTPYLASMNDTAILDSVWTINLLSAAEPCVNK